MGDSPDQFIEGTLGFECGFVECVVSHLIQRVLLQGFLNEVECFIFVVEQAGPETGFQLFLNNGVRCRIVPKIDSVRFLAAIGYEVFNTCLVSEDFDGFTYFLGSKLLE